MIDHDQLIEMLTRLKLTAIRDQLDSLLDEAAGRELTLREALGFFCAREVARKDERRTLGRDDSRFRRGVDGGSLTFQLAHAGAQQLCASRRKVRRLELVERAFQGPAEVARAQAPDFSPNLRLTREGAAPPGSEAHRSVPWAREDAGRPFGKERALNSSSGRGAEAPWPEDLPASDPRNLHRGPHLDHAPSGVCRHRSGRSRRTRRDPRR